MKVSSEKIEGCMVALTVEVEPEEMEKAVDSAYRRMVQKVDIPGFRRGKAPRSLVERHLGKESLDAEALDRLIPELYDRAIGQEGIEAIGQPDVELTQPDPPVFKATVPVRPIVELGDHRSIRVTQEKVEITEEDVAKGIDNLRHMQATWEPVEREAQVDDMVIIDAQGTVGEKTILDSKGSQYRITPDLKMPVPGFAEQMVGMKAGDEKEFKLPFPEEHESEELAGKDCQFKVTVTDVKEERTPELDDEFAKSMGQGIENVEQLRERLRENMRASADRDSRLKLENGVIDALAAQSKVEFPYVLTEREIDHMANDQLMRVGGVQLEDFLRYRGLTEEQFRNELRPAAERRVTSSLVLNKVYEAENIEISDAEVDAEIGRLAEESGDQEAQVRQFMGTAEARESLRGRLLTEKTMNQLIEIATGGQGEPSGEEPRVEESSEAESGTEESIREEETADDSA